jgi:hypothetical protein
VEALSYILPLLFAIIDIDDLVRCVTRILELCSLAAKDPPLILVIVNMSLTAHSSFRNVYSFYHMFNDRSSFGVSRLYTGCVSGRVSVLK